MEPRPPKPKSTEELLSKVLVDLADYNAHLLTVLDLQARIIARLEEREQDDVVDEVNELLKERRRAALSEIEYWALGTRPRFDGP